MFAPSGRSCAMPGFVVREAAHTFGAAGLHRRMQRREDAHEHAGRVEARPELEGPGRHLADDAVAARLRRGHRVEQVASDAGIVERVEHRPDHHGLAARRRELLVPGEIFESLLTVEQERAAPS